MKQKEDKFPHSYYEDEIKPHIENDIKPMAAKHSFTRVAFCGFCFFWCIDEEVNNSPDCRTPVLDNNTDSSEETVESVENPLL